MKSPLPGAVGVSGLRVYDWPAADGLCGGSPHVHLTCTEAYVVIGGAGHVQTLTYEGFAETALEPGAVVWFTPGTIHRLINGDGSLRIVVIMQNSGLPEAGDAVFTFPPGVLADPRAYERAAGDDPRYRRDLAIEGFLELRRRTETGDREALDEFFRAGVAVKSGRFDEWEERWRTGALAAAARTGDHLKRLRDGDRSHLREAGVQRLCPPDETTYGMCGHLDTYRP